MYKLLCLGSQQITKDLTAIFLEVANPFDDYQTEHKRMQQFSANGLVKPISFSVGRRLEGSSTSVRNVYCQLQYVPLQHTLKLLYSNPEFVKALSESSERYLIILISVDHI